MYISGTSLEKKKIGEEFFKTIKGWDIEFEV
jgi:hypothetical protein